MRAKSRVGENGHRELKLGESGRKCHSSYSMKRGDDDDDGGENAISFCYSY